MNMEPRIIPQTQLLPAIALRTVSFRFPKGALATCQVSMEIAAGEIFCLLGPNGAGKTTLIRLITGELTPEAGAIAINGQPVGAATRALAATMGILPQSVGLFDGLTVRQHLDCFARLKGIAGGQLAATLDALIDRFRLTPLLKTRAGVLSLGQKRWVLVALAMLGDPGILILDEPTVGMDPVARQSLWDILRAARHAGTTILLTTQYLDEAEHLSDRVGFFKEGQLVLCGTLADLYAEVGDSFSLRINDPATGTCLERLRFKTLPDAQRHVMERAVESYSVGRISLEDIYLGLFGRPRDPAGTPPERPLHQEAGL